MPSNDEPFLKWAGGKRWLAPAIADIARLAAFNRYFEPFLGGGAVFFALKPRLAFLSDVNTDLINVYKQVRRVPKAAAEELSKLILDPTVYETVRRSRPRTAVGRAVRFLYLNRAAFNGLYRVNRRGEFNVPFGCKPTTQLPDETRLRIAARSMTTASFSAISFEEALREVAAGDFVYLDPPYTVKHDNNGFRRYNESLFTWDDQERLASAALRLVTTAAHVVVSNANHREVRRLYCRCHFSAFRVTRPSNMASSPASRGRADELLLVGKTIADGSGALRSTIAKHVTVRATPLVRTCGGAV